MAFRFNFNTTRTEFLWSRLYDAIVSDGHNIESIVNLLDQRQIGVDFVDALPDATEQAQVQAIIDAHDATDYEQIQADEAISNLRGLFSGLRQLPPEDAAYAAYGRGWAIKNGEPQEVILGIVDRQTAGAYITAQSEWQNLPVESRQFHIDHIDAMIKLVQGVIRAIT